jgi:hypothetical protein
VPLRPGSALNCYLGSRKLKRLWLRRKRKMSKIEKGQVYLAIALFIVGYGYDVREIMNLSASIFIGMGIYYYWEAKKGD